MAVFVKAELELKKERTRKDIRLKKQAITMFGFFILAGMVLLGYGLGATVQNSVSFSQTLNLNSIEDVTNIDTFTYIDDVNDIVDMLSNYHLNRESNLSYAYCGFILIISSCLMQLLLANEIDRLKRRIIRMRK